MRDRMAGMPRGRQVKSAATAMRRARILPQIASYIITRITCILVRIISRRRRAMRATTRGVIRHGTIWGAVGAAFAASLSALAQPPLPPPDPNQRQVYLVHKEGTDCTNSDVPNVNSPLVVGNIWVTRRQDGNTSVTIAVTATPGTTYQFFAPARATSGPTTRAWPTCPSPSRPPWSARSTPSTCLQAARRREASSRAHRSRFGNRT